MSIYNTLMVILKALRKENKRSQRALAKISNLSFRTIQQLEGGKHDPRISTLSKISKAFGYNSSIFEKHIWNFFLTPASSARDTSRFFEDHNYCKDWKIPFFNFVDTVRREKKEGLVKAPPLYTCSQKLKALLASTVESLCDELHIERPDWAKEAPALKEPWFLSEVENLKASALIESPTHFRKRNIFVLDNFLHRV